MDLEKIIREYIDKSIHLSLGTSINNRPWVCEVHFVYDNNLNLYFRSLKSRRHSQEIEQNPNVAGNIVKQHSLTEGPHAIYFEGKATMLHKHEERKTIFHEFKSRLGVDDSILLEAENELGSQFYKIVVNNWYAFGKFSGESYQKYKLKWN